MGYRVLSVVSSIGNGVIFLRKRILSPETLPQKARGQKELLWVLWTSVVRQ
jgi:hypothetical protein